MKKIIGPLNFLHFSGVVNYYLILIDLLFLWPHPLNPYPYARTFAINIIKTKHLPSDLLELSLYDVFILLGLSKKKKKKNVV